jgi:hypothetical protein
MRFEEHRSAFVSGLILLTAVGASLALAQSGKEDKPGSGGGAAQSEMPLPPGWTAEDMKACTAAGIPGKMHEQLAKRVGTWTGQALMWMGPGNAEPVKSECTWTVTSLMDGRYLKCEMSSNLPGMGPFEGTGLTGYDNVAQRFVGAWIDNHSTGIMNGVGEVTPDGKLFTWVYGYTCPITKKPTTLRQVETVTGPDSLTFEMFGKDPKSGTEFKAMHIDFKKKS